VKIKNKNKMKTNYSADYIAKSEALKSHPTTKLADAYEAWIAASYGTDNEAYAKADAAYAVLKKLHNKKSK